MTSGEVPANTAKPRPIANSPLRNFGRSRATSRSILQADCHDSHGYVLRRPPPIPAARRRRPAELRRARPRHRRRPLDGHRRGARRRSDHRGRRRAGGTRNPAARRRRRDAPEPDGRRSRSRRRGDHVDGKGSRSQRRGDHVDGKGSRSQRRGDHVDGKGSRSQRRGDHVDGKGSRSRRRGDHVDGRGSRSRRRGDHVDGKGSRSQRRGDHVDRRGSLMDRYAYWNKILHVNLADRTTSVEEPGDAFFRRYAGGRGLIAHYLLKYVPKGADPLGPDNILVIAPGVLTGAPVPGAGRHSVGAKSPLTGGFGESESGGYWGAELKRAGWDAIVFHGVSPTPVYLWINQGAVEIRDAAHLWGKITG